MILRSTQEHRKEAVNIDPKMSSDNSSMVALRQMTAAFTDDAITITALRISRQEHGDCKSACQSACWCERFVQRGLNWILMTFNQGMGGNGPNEFQCMDATHWTFVKSFTIRAAHDYWDKLGYGYLYGMASMKIRRASFETTLKSYRKADIKVTKTVIKVEWIWSRSAMELDSKAYTGKSVQLIETYKTSVLGWMETESSAKNTENLIHIT